MEQDFLNTRAFFLFLAALIPFLLASGCGGSGDSGSDKITVQTGSLTKAKFVKQADELCQGTKGQFLAEYQIFTKSQSGEGAQSQVPKMVETVLVPTYEKLIDQISSLGAPSGDVEEISKFLNALQQDLDQASTKPLKIFSRLTPFGHALKLANAYGLPGCVESLGGRGNPAPAPQPRRPSK